MGPSPGAGRLRNAGDHQPHRDRRRDPRAVRDYIAHIARLAVKDIGYEEAGFHWEKAAVEVHESQQNDSSVRNLDFWIACQHVYRRPHRHPVATPLQYRLGSVGRTCWNVIVRVSSSVARTVEKFKVIRDGFKPISADASRSRPCLRNG
jgi:hypothetical protein